MRRISLALLALLTCAAASAAAASTNSIHIGTPRHARVGQRLRLTFSGHDSAPSNTLGADIDALLALPRAGGPLRCRSDLALTEQNHPGVYIELARELPVDRAHRGYYTVNLYRKLHRAGRWRICAWQYNNDGISTTSSPASHAMRTMFVLGSVG